ncbi:molybdate ABC transporter substrate-binding protein [Argonema antarcticum]|uniref:molybdate ABC transporter substrate-binding protein n=1 Tax=Argonema antarcticum TaxID=2942763 RepID=UPI0020113AE3|nr:molybdate ABC transporter substrate-binding protein [Argonema antarcticum]MCL1471257.1 molybdate ABC transporter substrate-binding protein [Argonema antarcticum A004/B2]
MKSFQWMALCFVSFVLALWLGSCSSPPTQVVNLNFGAAGMVRNAMPELEKLYQQEHPHVVINCIFAGSGVIQTAIERGEPFDGVFFADIPPLNELQAKGLILPESRKELVSTDIVLIAPTDSSLQLANFQELADDRLKTVAVGNKNLAIGRYTHILLTRLGIDRAVASKAVVVKVDVREVLRAVELGEAEVGITFLSEAKASAKVKVLAIAPRDFYHPIRTGVAVIKTSAHPQEMQAYLDFLSTDRALAIFEKFGLRPLRS